MFQPLPRRQQQPQRQRRRQRQPRRQLRHPQLRRRQQRPQFQLGHQQLFQLPLQRRPVHQPTEHGLRQQLGLAPHHRLAHKTERFECVADSLAGMIDAGLSNRGHFARRFWQNIEIVITKRLRNLGDGKFVLPHYARSENKQRPLPCDMMEGFLAGLIMIACGEATGGSASVYPAFSQLLNNVEAPLVYGGTDVDLVTGTETPPHIIQSETYSTANPDDPNEICVAFNDSRGATVNQFSGLSCSTDGGATFTRVINGSGQGLFANTFGDPVVLYNKPTQTWFTV